MFLTAGEAPTPAQRGALIVVGKRSIGLQGENLSLGVLEP
jgi:hypothetical protein